MQDNTRKEEEIMKEILNGKKKEVREKRKRERNGKGKKKYEEKGFHRVARNNTTQARKKIMNVKRKL